MRRAALLFALAACSSPASAFDAAQLDASPPSTPDAAQLDASPPSTPDAAQLDASPPSTPDAAQLDASPTPDAAPGPVSCIGPGGSFAPCSGGLLCCAGGDAGPALVCVDAKTDRDNCGICGDRCADGTTCQNRQCL